MIIWGIAVSSTYVSNLDAASPRIQCMNAMVAQSRSSSRCPSGLFLTSVPCSEHQGLLMD